MGVHCLGSTDEAWHVERQLKQDLNALLHLALHSRQIGNSILYFHEYITAYECKASNAEDATNKMNLSDGERRETDQWNIRLFGSKSKINSSLFLSIIP